MAEAKAPNLRNRPLSPHLQIYKPMLTMMMSIVHRITGGALYIGTLLLVWWLIAAAAGPNAYAAVVRETLEETAWHFVPRHLLGLYLWRNPQNGQTVLRAAVIGDVTRHEPQRALDAPVVAAHWLTRDSLLAQPQRLRSPLVLRCVEDCLAGQRHALSALQHLIDRPVAQSA